MGSCILKKIKVEAGKWFLEEGVVLPWSLRNERNESILRYYGLRKKNFPCPCQTSNAAVKAASVRQERKQHPIRAAVKVPSSTIFDADFRHWQEDEKTEVDFDEQNSGAPSLHDLARAATNAFGVDAEEEDPSVPMIAGHCHYKVQADALLKHCGFAQDNTIEGRIAAEIFVKGHDAVIVRALISTISPSPRTTLSDYDIGFWDTTLFDGMTQCRDILGVVDGNNYEARKLVWDLNACVTLRDLALALKCTLVKDMEIDRIWKILRTQREVARSQASTENHSKLPGCAYDFIPKLSIKKKKNGKVKIKRHLRPIPCHNIYCRP